MVPQVNTRSCATSMMLPPAAPIAPVIFARLPAMSDTDTACIEDPIVIEKILAHLNAKAGAAQPSRPPPSRAPPTRAFG